MAWLGPGNLTKKTNFSYRENTVFGMVWAGKSPNLLIYIETGWDG
jgi:hypothetical protein